MTKPDEGVKQDWLDRALSRASDQAQNPFAVIGVLIGLVGTLPTVYGWLYPPDPVRLLIHYDPFTVYDPGKPVGFHLSLGVPTTAEFNPLVPTTLPDPPIKVISSDGQTISTPIFDMEVSIWNGGTEPINRDKIRRPLVLTFPHVDTLLGIRILHQNPNDGLKIATVSSSPASIQVSWDYMDPGTGFKLAVVFATASNLYPLVLNSYIAANVIDTDRVIPGVSWRSVATTLVLVVAWFFTLVAILGRVRRYRLVFAIAMAATPVFAAILTSYYLVSVPTPPF